MTFFLKNIFSRFTSLVTMYHVYTQVNVARQTFPGFSSEVRLRVWLLENLGILSRLTLQTANSADGAIVSDQAD
ncbi:MAG: hypothetical protein LBQ54_12100 [Planctomycetaceae bacterium]|nr:hypothetical protein [Planctomycetaceae bacterium]